MSISYLREKTIAVITRKQFQETAEQLPEVL